MKNKIDMMYTKYNLNKLINNIKKRLKNDSKLYKIEMSWLLN